MEKIQANIIGENISTNSADAFSLYKKSYFGEPIGEKIKYSFPEALYLEEKKYIEIFQKNKRLSFKELIKKIYSKDQRINVKYTVFKDLRNKGYIVKTALKFGADFRVYEKGTQPGLKHAKWIVFADYESKKMTWHEFAARNRVAHSTKKNLLLAIVDEENSVSYYEVRWIKP